MRILNNFAEQYDSTVDRPTLHIVPRMRPLLATAPCSSTGPVPHIKTVESHGEVGERGFIYGYSGE